jgi:TPP-dependent pyruvate/acetoin dehydrogenase alpha subunit
MLNEIISRAKICRAFETAAYNQIQKKNIKIPVYLSAGQEMISSTISVYCKKYNISPLIFGQHRCHSIYLNFGGDPIKLIDELLGLDTGCTKGMGGSASINCSEINMYGHDGLMGSNIPIGVGACFASKKPTIVFAGDAAAEEDYALAAYGWASTKNIPILFVVEDNNLSILTEKKVRRNWEINDVSKSMGIESFNISDEPNDILNSLNDYKFNKPRLLNINTNRLFWHCGAGKDGDSVDWLEKEDITKELEYFEELWKSRLEKL